MTGETQHSDANAGAPGSAERLEALGLVLPELRAPENAYVDWVLDGTSLYLSGKGPRRPDGSRRTGKLGGDISLEEGREDARLAGINLLAAMRDALGSLERVERVVKILGLVNATPDFTNHPQVIDGCSDLMLALFDDRGRHARSAFGVGSLPNGMTVEIEMIVRILP
ncbi:RidA family protein [Pseudohoeflea coraliihabitans]|uniref:RidA family protein n=1 Tax=Pseudohoeflea coraliihabitans TaxID=2860393 RepID=A0ABS6WNF0_9HYPH|nr:RidA family protein [Pseudohoeflea sp. DP4N28-3]MBW3096630.1 RidA family protein [Pseudohoeflea sp. DP4N28-3]